MGMRSLAAESGQRSEGWGSHMSSHTESPAIPDHSHTSLYAYDNISVNSCLYVMHHENVDQICNMKYTM